MEQVFIYALADPRTGKYFYVGSSEQPDTRKSAYCRGRGANFPSRHIIYDLLDSGLKPRFVILDKCCRELRDKTELEWIQKFLSEGHPITNKNKPYYGRRHK